MDFIRELTDLVARILMSVIFVISGIGKIGGYAGTQAYMIKMGVPGGLLPLVILLELGGSLAIVLGWKTRWAAFALAGFCILAALFFHTHFSNQVQAIMFMKNLAMAGGFLTLSLKGAGAWSLDRKSRRR